MRSSEFHQPKLNLQIDWLFNLHASLIASNSPCEDILGATWLRVAAWFVSCASVVGNLLVIVILMESSRFHSMPVSKFLMVNLAIADLCMGVYLFLIVGMDVNTIGVYFNYAIDWQNGKSKRRI